MKYFIVLILLFVTVELYSQKDNDFRIRRTNPRYEEGDWIGYSMTRWTRTLAQGLEYVYFATTGGIARYNYFTNKWNFPWTKSNGLADNNVLAVGYDVDTNYLWCSTPLGVSCYFSTFRRWENYYNDEIGLNSDDEIISIGFDRDYVWLETSSGVLLQGNKQGGGYFKIVSHVPDTIRWFGYRGHNTKRPPHFFMGGEYFFDSDGFISDVQLNQYRISDWVLDKWGNYWVGIFGLGVGKAQQRIEQLELLRYGLFLNNVSAMQLDKENEIMWIGGQGQYQGESGITSWDISTDQWSYYRAEFISELRNDQITSIAVDEYPYVWFGTEYGLALFNQDKNQWRIFDVFTHLTDNYVYDVAVDENNVWVATISGLTRIFKESLESDSLEAMEITPRSLRQVKIFDVELMGNLVWLGTEYGVFVYDALKNEGGFQAEAGGPLNEEVYAASSYENEIWFGSVSGVEVYDMEKKEWLGRPYRRVATNDTINYIKAGKYAVWAATNHGVLKFDRKRKLWVRFTTEDGLIDDIVTSVVLDGDYVWFGTPNGITRFYWNAPYRID